MQFRNARMTDASSLAAISMEVWIGTYLRNGVNAFFADYALAEFTTARFEELIDNHSEYIIVSDNEDGIDGFIHISFDSTAPVAEGGGTEIKTLYVQPRHHGKGIGTGLLKAGLERCAARNVDRVWLTVNSENTSAIAFYAAQGFQNIGKTDFQIADKSYPNDVLLRLTN